MRSYYFHKMTVCKGCEIFPLAALKFTFLFYDSLMCITDFISDYFVNFKNDTSRRKLLCRNKS